ncbi:MAG: hypothetical protein AABM42_06845 [Actinomycetota bacterium]
MPSGDPLVLELGPAGGPALRVEWNVEALRQLSATPRQPGTGEARPTWRLEREPDWGRAGALRVISASFDDGALLGVAALRPRGAAGHDADVVRAVLVSAQGEVAQLHDALLSAEYGPDGRARRLGLELYEDPGGPALRIVADRAADARQGAGGEQTALRLRMEGIPGTGLHELVPAG